MKVQRKTNTRRNKIIILILALLLISAGSYAVYAYGNNTWPFPASETQQADTQDATSPPTPEEEAEQSQDGKKSEQQEDRPPEKDASGKTVVSVGVSYADIMDGAVEVRAFTPSVVEGNGTCTATLTRGGVKVSDASSAFVDSTTSQCEPIRIPLTRFEESGVWTLVVTYSSQQSKGTSESVEVTIP